MRRGISVLIVFVLLFSLMTFPSARANPDPGGWGAYSEAVQGLGDIGQQSTPSIAFNVTGDGNWTLISGENTGVFYGYYWNGTQWVSDSSRVAGLGDVGSKSAPCMGFNLTGDGNWTLIAGVSTPNAFYGFYWNGSQWVSDDSRATGLTGTGYDNPAFAFNVTGDGNWTCIVGRDDGVCNGFYWNGSGWTSDSVRAAGLEIWQGPYWDASPAPSLAYNTMNDNKWTCIMGSDSGVMYGYYWNGSGWTKDDDRVEGLGDIGSSTKPCLSFNLDGNNCWILISGLYAGTFLGYRFGILCSVTVFPDTRLTWAVNDTGYTCSVTLGLLGGYYNFTTTVNQTLCNTSLVFSYWKVNTTTYSESNITMEILADTTIELHFSEGLLSLDDFETNMDGWATSGTYFRGLSVPYYGIGSCYALSGYETTDPFADNISKTFDFTGLYEIALDFWAGTRFSGLTDGYGIWVNIVDAGTHENLVGPSCLLEGLPGSEGTYYHITLDCSNASDHDAVVYLAVDWEGWSTLPHYSGDGKFDAIKFTWTDIPPPPPTPPICLTVTSDPIIPVSFTSNGFLENTPFSTTTVGSYYLVATPDLVSNKIPYYFVYWTVDGVSYNNLAVQVSFSGTTNVTVVAHYIVGGTYIVIPPKAPAVVLPSGGLLSQILSLFRTYWWFLLILLLVVLFLVWRKTHKK